MSGCRKSWWIASTPSCNMPSTHQTNNRIAAYMLALDRVAFAIKLRGIYA